jgi:hypothetical protein
LFYINRLLSQIRQHMSLLMKKKFFGPAALMLGMLTAGHAWAQEKNTCKNQYPCGYCAVYDNNGNDLAGFVHDYSRQLSDNGSKVLQASNDDWGYLLVRTVHVPSVSSKWETKGDLNHQAFISTTLVMNKTKEGSVATWWARECNLPNGPVVQLRVDEDSKVAMPMQRYERVLNGLEPKKLTMVEYLDTFNMRDYDNLMRGSHLMVKSGTIKKEDYQGLVSYFNTFLSKFSYIDDPILTKMSFVTFYTGASNTRYIAYFNSANEKLSGRLQVLDLQYERDKDTVVKHTFHDVTASTVYIYGDDTYGMDKNIIKYAKEHGYKLRRRKTDVTTKFNDER